MCFHTYQYQHKKAFFPSTSRYPGRYADVKPPLHDIVDDLKDKTTKQKVTKPEPVPASIKQIRDREHVNLKFQGESGYDTFRPGNTLATWEMGFRYTHR